MGNLFFNIPSNLGSHKIKIFFISFVRDEIIVEYDPSPYELNTAPLPPPEIPADNALTVQGVKLGRMLFYDPILSKNEAQSCVERLINFGQVKQPPSSASQRRFFCLPQPHDALSGPALAPATALGVVRQIAAQ